MNNSEVQSKIEKLQLMIEKLNGEKELKLLELGKRYYNKIITNEEVELDNLVKDIEGIFEEIEKNSMQLQILHNKEFCQQCNAALEEDVVFCSECGTRVKEEVKSDGNDISCKSCDNIMSKDSKFCNLCGEKVEQSTESSEEIMCEITCLQCGNKVEYDDRFCIMCGQAVERKDI